MIDNRLKRYVLVSLNNQGNYALVDTHLKASFESSMCLTTALRNNFGVYGPIYYQCDIPKILLGEYSIITESDYPITKRTNPELFI